MSKRKLSKHRGQASVEYAVCAAVIALVTLCIVMMASAKTRNVFVRVNTMMASTDGTSLVSAPTSGSGSDSEAGSDSQDEEDVSDSGGGKKKKKVKSS